MYNDELISYSLGAVRALVAQENLFSAKVSLKNDFNVLDSLAKQDF